MKAADELAKHVGVKPACAALEVSRSTLYRRRGPTGQQQPRPTPARALSEKERDRVFDTLCSERFVDRSPAEVVATLLDEEVYLCSERTMYRVLASQVPVRERRAQRSHPEYQKPELMATGPGQVWSWDITRLLGPRKWSYFYLYVIMDIFSRYIVGWMVADRESSALAGRLIQQSCLKHGVQPRVLTLHSDRGAPMTSQCTAQLLADLGVTRSLSRPQVSDDNPFSEAQFKTLKYHPSFPGRFEDQGQAKTFCRSFFRWYNAEHRHGGISMLTPEQVHFGNATQVIAGREASRSVRQALQAVVSEGGGRTRGRLGADGGVLRLPRGSLEASTHDERGREPVRCATAQDATAAKRFKRVESATALIWKLLLVAEKRFRRLDAPHLLKDVFEGRKFEDGKPVSTQQRKNAA